MWDAMLKLLRYLLVATSCCLTTPRILACQDKPPLTMGDFDTQGSVTAGFRATSVTGQQHRNISSFLI